MNIEHNTLKIVFMGTPQFGAIILKGLIRQDYKPILVITAPDKPVGRKHLITPSPVKITAQEHAIPYLQPLKISACTKEIEDAKPDIIIVAAYGQILPDNILKIPRSGCLNVHPSLLPKYRGPSPIQTAILQGEKETGVTIFLIDERIDHGKILSRIRYQVSNTETYESLSTELAHLGVKLLTETIPSWVGRETIPQLQDEAKATYTKIITKGDGSIDWHKSATEIERQIRAFSRWPGSFTRWKKNTHEIQVKIMKTHTDQSKNLNDEPVGKTFLSPTSELGVRCGKGVLVIEQLQLEGKKPLPAEEFLRGHPDFIDTTLK